MFFINLKTLSLKWGLFNQCFGNSLTSVMDYLHFLEIISLILITIFESVQQFRQYDM